MYTSEFYLTSGVRFFYCGGEIVKEEKIQAKQALVDEIKEKIQGAHSIVLLNNNGINVEDVTALRAKYRQANVDYKVYKNTMLRRAFQELGYDGLDEVLKGPSAVAFGMEDPASAAKISSEFVKDHDSLEIKSGIVDGRVIGVEEVEALAKLPTKEVLIAQVLGGLNAPIQGLANVLTGNLRGLAIVLQRIAEKQEANA